MPCKLTVVNLPPHSTVSHLVSPLLWQHREILFNAHRRNGYTISGEGEALLQDYPHPDTPTNAVGMYHQSMKMHSQARDGTNDTGSSSVSNDYHTPTGSVSVYSWGMDEAVRYTIM